jgi:hypothetical protein
LDFPSEKSCFQKEIVHKFLGSQLNWFRIFPQQESICPLLDLITVLSFEENQVFKGRGIFLQKGKVSEGNGSKNDII